MRSRNARTTGAAAAAGLTLLAMTGVAGLPATAAGSSAPAASSATERDRVAPYLDARVPDAATAARATARQLRSSRASLEPQAVVDYDPLTGTVRNLARLDGYLTGPSSAPAARVALDFLRTHLATVGLTAADLATLRLRRDLTDGDGTHHLSWTQSVRGTPVFGNGLQVTVTRTGRVLSVQGSPVSGLADLAAAAPAAARLDATAARRGAAADVRGRLADAPVAARSLTSTRWGNDDMATRVWFLTPDGLRPGWSTYVHTGPRQAYQHVVDAVTGTVLFRRSTVARDRGDGYAYDYYPGAPAGGTPQRVNLVQRGWLKTGASSLLQGTSAQVWSDVDADDEASASEETAVPGNATGPTFPLQPFGTAASASCATYVCTWNPDVAYSWRRNRQADAVNAFYLASNFHDYLAARPINFTPAAGNFSAAGGDPVRVHAILGADIDDGLPDDFFVDNAGMSTPPDGISPDMYMLLWHTPGLDDEEDPFLPTSGSFDVSVLYHEYTHGLSNRLVVDAAGNSTLNDLQAGAMGEAWSDYYAMDYLVTKGFQDDSAAPGDIVEGEYVTKGVGIRTMPTDCPVESRAAVCTRIDGTRGGYTYSDLSGVAGFPEVHASGEVWTQTLWDLRAALGHWVATGLITSAMSLSPADPDYLDMRNAIVQADQVRYGGAHRAAIWRVFAHRGMGFYAGSIDSADTAPADDFHVPPPVGSPRVSMAGTVVDPDSGDPVSGAVVSVTGQPQPLTAVTDRNGRYTIPGLYAGTYAKVIASAPGYLPVVGRKATGSGKDFALRRDWAATANGSTVVSATGADFSFLGCGPAAALDASQLTAWSTSTGPVPDEPSNVFDPKQLTLRLPAHFDLTGFGVDPSGGCGDDTTSSVSRYRIETSVDGTAWTRAAQGTFTADDLGRINDVAVSAGADRVQFVRFTMLGNQTPDFATACPEAFLAGCYFTDLTELAVFGTVS